MPPLQPSDLAILPRWRLDRFWSGAAALFWGAIFFGSSWLASSQSWQFGSWLTFVNEVPVPNRVVAMLAIAILLATLGILEIARSFRSPIAVIDKEAISFSTLFGWKRIGWKDVLRVSLDSSRYLTFEIADSGKRKHETIDTFRTRTGGEAIVRKLTAIRPDLVAHLQLEPTPPDPFRQESDFGHHIWP